LLLYLSIIASADEAGHRLIFPPFSSEDLKVPGLPLSEHLSYEELKAMPVEELRGVLSMGNFTDRRTATKERFFRIICVDLHDVRRLRE
jgi:hypothetical protein